MNTVVRNICLSLSCLQCPSLILAVSSFTTTKYLLSVVILSFKHLQSGNVSTTQFGCSGPPKKAVGEFSVELITK